MKTTVINPELTKEEVAEGITRAIEQQKDLLSLIIETATGDKRLLNVFSNAIDQMELLSDMWRIYINAASDHFPPNGTQLTNYLPGDETRLRGRAGAAVDYLLFCCINESDPKQAAIWLINNTRPNKFNRLGECCPAQPAGFY